VPELYVYDTLASGTRRFEPLDPQRIVMYVCGPTVYDEPHLGHARAAVVFDVLYRVLVDGYGDAHVTYVRNYTDIDDKIIARAKREEQNWDDVARRYTNAYAEAMQMLGCQTPTLEPKVSEVMDDIRDFIADLIERGHAYAADGSVYFDVASFPEYGKLSHRTTEELMHASRIEPDPAKRHPLDFALWKAAKPDEPAWDSPWGPGRPGWHIECSVMATKFGRQTLDLHGGGLDLIFPHHENEIAQCEGRHAAPFARYWVHNGFVRIDRQKMSKSLGNFTTVGAILSQWPPEVLRYLLLAAHYRSPLEFQPDSLLQAAKALFRIYDGFRALSSLTERPAPAPELSTKVTAALLADVEAAPGQVQRALYDDLNTPEALAAVFTVLRHANRVRRHRLTGDPGRRVDAAVARLRQCLDALLGLGAQQPQMFFDAWNIRALSRLQLAPDTVEQRLAMRAQARESKDWAEADRIRDELVALGIELEDAPEGTRWRVAPEALLEPAR